MKQSIVIRVRQSSIYNTSKIHFTTNTKKFQYESI